MAKGLRSSVTKTNKRALRKKVFGPVEAARTERLSAKLQELAAQPRPESTKMDMTKDPVEAMDKSATRTDSSDDPLRAAEDMDLDDEIAAAHQAATQTRSSKSKRSGKVEKRRHRKAKNEITFRLRKKDHLKSSKRRRI